MAEKVVIGNATLYLGDCREVLPSLDTTTIGAVITDPPYGMQWDGHCVPGRNGNAGGHTRHHNHKIMGDDEAFNPAPWLTFPRVVLWGMHHFQDRLPRGTTLVWIKRFDHAFGTFLSDADLAWMKGGHGVYCKRGPMPQAMASDRSHPTEKPVELMSWCIEKSNIPRGGLVADPYMGSGPTGVAAIQRGMGFIGIEIERKYFDIACERISRAQAQGSLLQLDSTPVAVQQVMEL